MVQEYRSEILERTLRKLHVVVEWRQSVGDCQC